MKGKFKYRFSDNGFSLNSTDIKKFLEAVKEGNLKSYFKSQDLAIDAEENNVKVLSGNKFVEQVKGKNVFVFFYAPWCGHCKSSKPE